MKPDDLLMNSYSVDSLFSGAGGLILGFANQGFNIIWANDNNEDTYCHHRLLVPDSVVVHEYIKD